MNQLTGGCSGWARFRRGFWPPGGSELDEDFHTLACGFPRPTDLNTSRAIGRSIDSISANASGGRVLSAIIIFEQSKKFLPRVSNSCGWTRLKSAKVILSDGKAIVEKSMDGIAAGERTL